MGVRIGVWGMYVVLVAIGYVERMLVKLGTLRHPADADISAPVTLELSCRCLLLNLALNIPKPVTLAL